MEHRLLTWEHRPGRYSKHVHPLINFNCVNTNNRTPLPKQTASGLELMSSRTTEISRASTVWSALWGRCTASSWNTSVHTHTQIDYTLSARTSDPVLTASRKGACENNKISWAQKHTVEFTEQQQQQKTEQQTKRRTRILEFKFNKLAF